MNIIIIYDHLSNYPDPDEIDTLVEARSVHQSCKYLGYTSSLFEVDDNLNGLEQMLLENSPDLVINLVESIDLSGKQSYKIPEILEKLQIPFSGESSLAIELTTNKIATKKLLAEFGLPTPTTIFPNGGIPDEINGQYIIKPIYEDASKGITDSSIVEIKNKNDLDQIIKNCSTDLNYDFFIEEYISGREWNISILNIKGIPSVLPPAEMLFNGFDSNRPKILNYESKWDTGSFEYINTNRNFDQDFKDNDLIKEMEIMALRCWEIFKLKNYSRIDFRTDALGNPYILELNANPCISPDAGLPAAAAQMGIDYNSLIKIIIENSI